MEKFKAAILSEQNKPLIVKNLTDQNPSKNQMGSAKPGRSRRLWFV